VEDLRHLGSELYELELLADLSLPPDRDCAPPIGRAVIVPFDLTAEEGRADPIIVYATLLVDDCLWLFLCLGRRQVLPHGGYGNCLLLSFLFFNGTSALHVA
jgi:hypothetical protein